MKLLALFALVALAAAVHRPGKDDWHKRRYDEREITSLAFESGRQYEYHYEGQLMSGIPQSSEQHSASRIKAYVVFQFQDERTVKMFLEHFDIRSRNGYVSEPQQLQPFTTFKPVTISQEHRDTLKQPLTFTYDNGMIDNVIFTSEEETWSANIKRSMMNLLQVNLMKKHEINPLKKQQLRSGEEEGKGVNKFDHFTTMEKSIEGECETEYSVVSMPPRVGREIEGDVLNVTRTIDFENCRRRPDIRYNYRFQTICPTCEQRFDKDERVLRSSTIVRQNMTASRDRSRSLIESIAVDSMYTIVPFSDDGNLVQAYAIMRMQLYRTRPIMSGPSMGSTVESDTDVMASVDWDVEKEEFFLHGNERTGDFYPVIPNKIEFVKSIVADLLKYMRDSVETEAPRHFARLVKGLRLLKKDSLQTASNQLCEGRADMPREDAKKACALYTDALALCGSKDCVDHLVEMIVEERIPTLKATMLLRKIMSIRTVSLHMVKKIWSIPSEKLCKKSPMLCQSAYLSVGSLLNAVCTENEDQLALDYKYTHDVEKRTRCNREDKMEWNQMLKGRFDQCKTDVCKVTLIKAIGNSGIDLAIHNLEKIIKSRHESTTVRVEAILALRLLAPKMPRKVQRVLVPLYMNKQEQPFVRMAAFNKIMETQPSKAIIDQLTIALKIEGNVQVASYVYTTFMSLANSTNPCEKRVADDITLSLRHARSLPISTILRSSKFVRAQGYGQYINRGLQLDINSIMGNYSFLPKSFVASLHSERANFWMKYLGTVGFTQSNLDSYLRRVMRRSGHHLQTALEDVLSGESESEEKSRDSSESDEYSPKFNYRNKLNKMFKDMEIASRESFPSSEKELLGNLYLRLFNQDYMFFPLDKNTLPAYIKEYLGKSGEDLSLETLVERLPLKSMQIPFNVRSATFGTESERKISTVFGMPLQLSTAMPAIAQASGILKFSINKEDRLTKFDVELKGLNPSFSVAFVEKVEIWCPIMNTGVKVSGAIKVHAPFDGKLSLDITKQQPQIKFTYKPLKTKYELVKLETTPKTHVLVWPRKLTTWPLIDEKLVEGDEWTRVHEINSRYGRNALGVEVHTMGKWHYAPARKVSTTPYSFLAGPNKLSIKLQPGIDQPSEYNVILSGKFFQDMPKKYIQPKFGKFDKFFAKSDEFLAESSSSSESHSGPDSSAISEEQEKRYKKYVDEYKSQGVVKNMVQLKFFTKGSSSVKREAHIKGTWECDKTQKTCNAVVDMFCAPITRVTSTPWKLLSKIHTLYPRTPYKVDELADSASKFLVQINTKWGLEEGEKYNADIKITAQQSDKLQEELKSTLYYKSYKDEKLRREHESEFSPVGQYEHTLKYGLLDEYKMHVDYKMSRQLKNITEKAFNFAKYYFYYQTQTDYQTPKGEQEINSIDARLNIDPINRRYINVTVETPTQRTKMSDMPVYETLVAPLNIRRTSSPARSLYGLLNEYASGEGAYAQGQGVCKIRSNRVTTFDGASYYKPVSTCYELLAADCQSPQSTRFAVYVRRQSQSTDRKVLRAVADGVQLTVRVAEDGDRLECATHEGQFTRCDDDRILWGDRSHPLLRVQSYDNQYIKVHLGEENVRVYFDGYAINVKAPEWVAGEMCGVCGNANDVLDECEVSTAKGECIDYTQPKDVRRMLKSYLMSESEGECEMESEYESESLYERRAMPWEDDVVESSESDECCAVFYEHTNYRGKQRRMCGYVPNIGTTWDNMISSVRIEPGCYVELYDKVNDKNWPKWEFYSSTPRVGGDANDKASSVGVYRN